MADRSRAYLKQEFNDGERPTGADFADLIDSAINKEDDGVRMVNGNLSLQAGLTLANTSAGVEGTLRFTGTQLEVFRGGAWGPLGGGGAFTPVAGGPDVAFTGGNVGIGNFNTAPPHRLDVPLSGNSGADQRIRLGNVAVHNGSGNDAAYVSHRSATTNQQFALRQNSVAETHVNSGSSQPLILMQGGNNPRLTIADSGNISLMPDSSVEIGRSGANGARNLVVRGNLDVHGTARKTGGGNFDVLSDARVKRDVKALDLGLSEIRRLKPVYYKYNGEAGTIDDGREYVGIVAQDIAEVMPIAVRHDAFADVGEGREDYRDLLTYDPSPLTYVLINAVRELAERVEQLETRLAALERPES
jgi:hypothetical protein